MPVVYEPSYSYYTGNRPSFSDKLHILDFKSDKVYIYTFLPVLPNTINIEHIVVDDLTENYFDTSTTMIPEGISGAVSTNYGRTRFFNGPKASKYFRINDIKNLGMFNFYENTNRLPNIELDILHLIDQTCINNIAFNLHEMDANVDYGLMYRNGIYGVLNHSTVTKQGYSGLLELRNDDIFSFNTGLGNITNLTQANINISPRAAYFFSNLTFSPTLIKENNDFLFPGKLNAKVTGPTTATVGDVLEYTITLMNSDMTDTFVSPPTVEVYPSSSAGVVSHRKVKLVNGVGKFKLDTVNLYSGETIEVKVGWKYITGDSKVSVTLS
jgi:hypothetical protein